MIGPAAWEYEYMIEERDARIAELEDQVEGLEARVRELETQLKAIEAQEDEEYGRRWTGLTP